MNPESAELLETSGEAPEEAPLPTLSTPLFLLAVEAELLETGE